LQLAALLGQNVEVDAPPDRMKGRDRNRAERVVEPVAAQQADAIGGEFGAPQPGAEDERDHRVLPPGGAQQRGERRVPGRDVPEFARDQKG
jgi:hypothetical protein